MGNCAKWDNTTLWTTVDNPVDNSRSRARDSMQLLKDKSLSNDLGDALICALSVLTARVEALEYHMAEYFSVIDRPLSPTESIEELRRLRDELI